MTGFISAHASGADWRAVVAEAGGILAGQNPEGGLGFAYVTEPLADHFADIVLSLRNRLGVEQWVGCVGLGVCATGTEFHDEPALSAMVAPWPDGAFHIFPSASNPDQVMRNAAGPWASEHGPVFGLAHGDPRNRHLVTMVESLPPLGEGYFVGGLTSLSDLPVQVAGDPAAGGLSGVMIAASVPVMVTHSQGCSPIGPFHTITESERSIVASLDGRPALDVLKEDVGEVLARDLNRIGGYIHVALPVPGSDTGDYTVRNLVGLDPNTGMIAVGADLEIGGQLMFVRRDPAAAQEDFTARLEDLKTRIGDRPIKGGLFVSCVARGVNMFGAPGREVGAIHDVLGSFPLTGFYANGEICGNRLYGYTGVLSVFL